MKKVILDTNFLIYCAKQKIDYVDKIRSLVTGKYELVTVKRVVDELERLRVKAKKFSDRDAVGLALKLLKINGVKILEIDGKIADDAIIKLHKGNIVATLDLNLAREVERGIIIRGRRTLAFR